MVALAGCGGGPAAKSPADKAAAANGGDNVGAAGTGNAADGPVGPVSFAPPVQQACMMHQEANTHHLCLSGSDGQCFHYGAVCQPEDPCVLELQTGEHKECKKFTEGRCDEFGKACKPKSSCQYDTKERRYRTCDAPKAGACGRFSATCDP